MNRPDIRNLGELENYQKSLKTQINLSSLKIKKRFSASVLLHPMKFLSRSVKHPIERIADSLRDPVGKLIPDAAALLLNKTALKKTGFFKRILLSIAAKHIVKKVLKPKSHNSTPDAIRKGTDELITKKTNTMLEQKSISPRKKKVSLKGIWEVLKSSFEGFGNHKVTKMSGSLAYYTVFSMGPLLIVIISLCGIFLEKDAAQGKVFDQLRGFLGSETALQLQDIIKNAAIGNKGTVAFIIGLITLLVGATSVFADIQDSINTIWGIKPKPKRGWLKMLQNRFLSFSVIISLGFLLLVSLGVTAILDGFSERLQARFADISVIVFYILNTIITLGVISAIFGVIFKVLPDANIKWKDVISGSLVTALLFMIGKFAISIYIGKSDVGGTYGAAGSLVILLLWTYYSSIILYFGAEFTKAYAVAYGSEIHPNHYAVTVKEVESELGGASVQETEKTKL